MMFDGLYFWNLIWSFFTLLSLVFVPVLFVMIYLNTRGPRAGPGQAAGPAASAGGAGAGAVEEHPGKRAA
ncbi:hypothetical protein [Nesterenkonia jeotgali]|nr:hypothetical protein [Nesterenkonia jeotgali]MBA8920250.1 hypothetical protein [Nesterenkonia jeotgali]